LEKSKAFFMKTLKIEWGEIQAGCKAIAESLKNKNVKTVFGIARGGIVPASLIARYLNADLVTVTAKSYNENNEREELYISPTDLNTFQGKNIVFVDDICDSGHTLDAFLQIAKARFDDRDIYTAAVLYKSNTVHTPDFYYKQITTGEWIIFPWETE